MDKLKVLGVGDSYWIEDGRGEPVSENEFVRRFHSVTGSDELDDYERHRNATAAILAGVAGAACLAWSIYGFSSLGAPDGSPYAMAGVIFGTGPALVGTGFAITFALSPDTAIFGGGRHDIADHDAHLYADRYNRALLRKRAREVRDSLQQDAGRLAPRLTLRPIVAPSFLGLAATF